ncbi:LysR family transcriptional regulator [Microbacterium excoecariae]|uniref:LysR family transcriptional regulator n=1 Tax=Microbacterium excoecariae TaxID=2715210 RepID=UPI0014097CD1|nr:LysR family transcriptional regulator [Microbacterium excoecariae]NHI16264.1 LysR family transcriptional regulator [Microbacterium excoecariae]
MSEITLKQLRCFVAVYTERSFTKAAQVLDLKQSPVSQAIAALERQLGAQLFDRGGREVTPTPAAVALFPEAVEMRRRAESLPQLVAAAKAGDAKPRIRLGAASSAFPHLVTSALGALEDFAVVVSDGYSAPLLRALDNGDIDVCLVRDFGDDREEERVAFRERFVVAVASGHPLASREEATIDEIVREPIITFRREVAPIAFDLMASTFLQAGAPMRVASYLSSEQAMLGLVAAGGGVTLVPQTVGLGDWHGVTFVPIAGAPANYPLTVRTSPGDPLGLLSPVTRALQDWARGVGIS